MKIYKITESCLETIKKIKDGKLLDGLKIE